MKNRLCLLAAAAFLLTGCNGNADDARTDAPVPFPTVTVTATATVTATVTAEPAPIEAPVMPDPTVAPDSSDVARPPLKLEVFSDGCGVIRSEPPAGVVYENLTWTFLDQDGFQVLGRNALGETRYRYYQGGTYTVVLEAWGRDSYVPVSNEVTIHC